MPACLDIPAYRWRATACALLLALTLPAGAQQVPSETVQSERAPISAVDATDVNASDLRARIEILESRTDLSSGEQKLVLDQLVAALGRAESAEAARAAAAEYTAALKAAPQTIAALRTEISLAAEQTKPATESSDDPALLQLQLASLQAEAVSLRSRTRTLDENLRAMVTRPAEARLELTDLRSQLDNVQTTITANASPLLAEASRLRLDATREELSARIEKTEQELLSLPTRESIAMAQRDLNARKLKQAEAHVASLQVRMNAQREAEAARQERDARDMFAQLSGHPDAVRELAAGTAKLRASLVQVTHKLDTAQSSQKGLRKQLEAVEEARRTAEQILGIGPIGAENGRLLRGLGKDLQPPVAIAQRIAQREASIVDFRVQRLQNQQRLRELDDAPAAARRYLLDAGIQPTPALVTTMTRLVEQRRAALEDLQSLQGQWVEALSETDALDTELQQRTGQLRTLLDERLLWLPSARPLGRGTWGAQLVQGVVWMASRDNWAQVAGTLLRAVKERTLSVLILLALVSGLFAIRPRLKKARVNLAKPVGTRDDSFSVTLLALGATVLLSLSLPLLFESLGWALRAPEQTGAFARALGYGLVDAGIVLFMLGVFKNMCGPHGLFSAHFGWDEKGTRRLGRALRMLAVVLVPAAFVTGLATAPGTIALAEGVGRLGFMTGSLALAWFMYRVFRPHRGALTVGLGHERLAWRTRHIWFWGLVLMPVALALMAASGYYATASALQSRLFTTGWIVLAIVIGYQIAMRGVLVAGRRTAYQQAKARHAKAKAKAETQADAGASGEAPAQHDEDDEIDVVSVSQQTRALLRATSAVILAFLLWGIWKELLPALNVFNEVVLWSQVVTGATGNSVMAVTLGDLMIGLLIFVLAVVAARNLPGFLEITVLQRSTIDQGTRYAIGTIVRYVILGLGLVVAFNHIGADWSRLQWVVAALGVGLGFGLQEIVANFISGIIILFERPVRVGDTVTIGKTSGTVTKIKIRAITITDFDNFEVLVPNKSFITESVQNWTLTSPTTRLCIKVGIGYDSDVARAQQIILDVASNHPNVLSKPGPAVLFLGFGESALQMELRAFVGKIEQRNSTLNDLHAGMKSALQDAGIAIPFPQRDLHVNHERDDARGPDAEAPREGGEQAGSEPA